MKQKYFRYKHIHYIGLISDCCWNRSSTKQHKTRKH